jgi:hypothetical protein
MLSASEVITLLGIWVHKRSPLSLLAHSILDVLIGTILLYGYVYSAYKYANPFTGQNDFFSYKEMVVRPFDLSVTNAPFVLRQIPAIVAFAFYKLGVYYNTAATVDLINLDSDTKRLFFALILSNSFAICLSLTILSAYLRAKLTRASWTVLFPLFGIFAGWFYFSTGVIAPLAYGWGWLDASLFVIAFIERNPLLTCVACLVGMFSRETTLVFALIMFTSVLIFGSDRRSGVILSVLALVVGCMAYLLIREQLTSGNEHQIAVESIISSLSSFKISREFLFQSILSQALLAMLVLAIALRDPRCAAYLLLSISVVTLVGIGAHVSQVALVVGEAVPFCATIFLLTHFGSIGGTA